MHTEVEEVAPTNQQDVRHKQRFYRTRIFGMGVLLAGGLMNYVGLGICLSGDPQQTHINQADQAKIDLGTNLTEVGTVICVGGAAIFFAGSLGNESSYKESSTLDA